jgi:hypothetical protein
METVETACWDVEKIQKKSGIYLLLYLVLILCIHLSAADTLQLPADEPVHH